MAINSPRHLHICLANLLWMTPQTKNKYSAINQIPLQNSLTPPYIHIKRLTASTQSDTFQLSHHSCHWLLTQPDTFTFAKQNLMYDLSNKKQYSAINQISTLKFIRHHPIYISNASQL